MGGFLCQLLGSVVASGRTGRRWCCGMGVGAGGGERSRCVQDVGGSRLASIPPRGDGHGGMAAGMANSLHPKTDGFRFPSRRAGMEASLHPAEQGWTPASIPPRRDGRGGMVEGMAASLHPRGDGIRPPSRREGTEVSILVHPQADGEVSPSARYGGREIHPSPGWMRGSIPMAP